MNLEFSTFSRRMLLAASLVNEKWFNELFPLPIVILFHPQTTQTQSSSKTFCLNGWKKLHWACSRKYLRPNWKHRRCERTNRRALTIHNNVVCAWWIVNTFFKRARPSSPLCWLCCSIVNRIWSRKTQNPWIKLSPTSYIHFIPECSISRHRLCSICL